MLEAIRIIKEEPQRRQRLDELTKCAHRHIAAHGLTTVGSGIAPIIAIVIPNERNVVQVASELQQEGYFVPAIRPPTVARGTSRLRLSLNIHHTPEQIMSVLSKIKEVLVKIA